MEQLPKLTSPKTDSGLKPTWDSQRESDERKRWQRGHPSGPFLTECSKWRFQETAVHSRGDDSVNRIACCVS